MTQLSVTLARNLGDLKARIADELARSDLTSQIALAIDDAIDTACTHRFWFNEVMGETLSLIAQQPTYSDSNIDALVEIDNLYLLVDGQRRNLRCANNDQINRLADGNPSIGEPYMWARYGTGIRFYPTPQRAYIVMIDGLSRGEPLEDDSDSNVWTTYGEKYVRALAKRELYAHVIQSEDKALVQDQLAQRYRSDLEMQTESRITTGEMAAYG